MSLFAGGKMLAIALTLVLNTLWTMLLIGLFFYDYYLALVANSTLSMIPYVKVSIAPGAAAASGFILLFLLSASLAVQIMALHRPLRIASLVTVVIEALTLVLQLGVGSKALSDIGTVKKWGGGSPTGGLLGVMGTIFFFVLVFKILNILAHVAWLMMNRDAHCTSCPPPPASSHPLASSHPPPPAQTVHYDTKSDTKSDSTEAI